MRLPLIVPCLLSLLVTSRLGAQTAPPAASSPSPNVVLILCDDMGYGDVGCYGSSTPTPNIDGMAREGVRFTDFYVGQAVCTASRAALLTGCYPNRISLLGALGPKTKIGINADELTLAEMFKSRGYATAIFGKWHLGHLPQFLPTRHGFDEYFGIPYSNDMWPKHPEGSYPPLPLIEGEKVVEYNPDQTKFTTEFTQRAVAFIERNKDHPFFLYLPHPMPHVPLHVSPERAGETGKGLYADVIHEIDWSVGQVLDTLKKNGLDERTMVIFMSDNGPWTPYGDHAGSSGGLREAKGTSFEGGVRVPCVVRWPGQVPAGAECHEIAASIDFLPTLARLIGATLPEGRTIDGKDIGPLLRKPTATSSPHEAFFIYWSRDLQAVRSGRWKLHLPHKYRHVIRAGSGGKPGPTTQPAIKLSLFDLETDPAEATDVAEKHPDVVARLQKLAESCMEDLGDGRTNRAGKGVRAPGKAEQE
jgi:arylsulfatase A-like enzyme